MKQAWRPAEGLRSSDHFQESVRWEAGGLDTKLLPAHVSQNVPRVQPTAPGRAGRPPGHGPAEPVYGGFVPRDTAEGLKRRKEGTRKRVKCIRKGKKKKGFFKVEKSSTNQKAAACHQARQVKSTFSTVTCPAPASPERAPHKVSPVFGPGFLLLFGKRRVIIPTQLFPNKQ